MNDRIKLDQNFKNSFIGEIIKVSNRFHFTVVHRSSKYTTLEALCTYFYDV